MAPRRVTVTDLASASEAGLGGRLVSVERVAGGTRKGVYRLTMADGATAIAYLWEESENYWREGATDRADPFSPGIGLDLWEAAYARLASLGLRVPEVYLTDCKRVYYEADLAIIEDFPGPELIDRYEQDPHAAAPTIARLVEDLTVMGAYRAPAYGKVAHVDAGGASHEASCEAAALRFGRWCLAEAADRDPLVADVRDRFADKLDELAAAVRPRTRYAVVHGELGLHHILVDRADRPVIIDIEDLMYFDVEWEHVQHRIRLEEDYDRLGYGVAGLDSNRIALYMLVNRLSLTAGPLRLLDGDYPNRVFMRDIAEWNRDRALEIITPPP